MYNHLLFLEKTKRKNFQYVLKFKLICFSSVLLLATYVFSDKAFGQYNFPVFEGPYNVTSNYFHFVNDTGNSTNVPTGNYDSFSVTVDWSNNGSGALSNQADLSIITSTGLVLIDPPTSTISWPNIKLTFSGSFSGIYDPDTDGNLILIFNQSLPNSNTNWANISITLFQTIWFYPPVSLSVSEPSITVDSASFSWDIPVMGAPIGYEYYYSTSDISPSDSATVNQNNVVTSLTTSISGLTQNTTYYWWVRALYGADTSSWASGNSFLTQSLTSVIWEEGFTDYLPFLWVGLKIIIGM